MTREKLIDYMHKQYVAPSTIISIAGNFDEKLADGSTMLGKAAKENKLIDEIGNIYDAEKWIKKELKIEPETCVY
jgi:ClpP class serine protease